MSERLAARITRARAALWWPAVFVLLVGPVLVNWPDLLAGMSCNPLLIAANLSSPSGWWSGTALVPGLPGWIDGNAGVTVQALGHLVVHDWLHGIVPWWNPYAGVGTPLAGEYQPAAFMFPFVFLLGLNNGVLWLKAALQIVAGFSTYALLRQLDASRLVALTGAICVQFCGSFAWAADSQIQPLPFLPLLLLGIEFAAARAHAARRGGWLTVAIAVAYSLLAGFPETAFIDGLLALAWAACRLGPLLPQPRVALRFAGKLACGGVAGLLLAAPALVSFAGYVSHAFLGGHGAAIHWVLPHDAYLRFLSPYAFGPILFDGSFTWWSLGGYAGLPIVVLALAGVSGRRERALRLTLAGWIVLALGASAGIPVLSGLINGIPFVEHTIFARYATYPWIFALILLAALALDDWRRAGRLPLVRTAAAAVAASLIYAAAVALAWPELAPLLADARYAWFLWPSAGGSLVAAACTGALLAGRRTRFRGRALSAVIVADLLVLFTVPLLSGRRNLTFDYGTVAFLRANLGLQRFYTLGPFAPNYGSFFGVASINHNMMPSPRAWIDYIRRHLDPHADPVTFSGAEPPPTPGLESRPEALRSRLPAYAAIGVRYVLAPPGTLPWPGAHLAHHGIAADIYDVPDAAPYFATAGSRCSIAADSRTVARVVCDGPATLIRRELRFPGWHVSMNGEPQRLQAAGEIFQRVDVPGGVSIVRFRYLPPYAALLWSAFSLGVLILAFGIAESLKTHHGSRPLQPDSSEELEAWPISKVAR